ncbi:CU044_5270 family protein [Sphaerisporangium fuscum]|uniref:CU044_5270 family protein n=1 Tax=Sphaerisporangium fuscum TaxID=2835868 RepID=UPI001BDC071F|nr:CU044_5270 family protein [Sphaerisporangium fuscum]
MNDSVDDMVTSLRPDALIDDSYRRRRERDLAHAFRTPRVPEPSRRFPVPQRRRPLLLIAGTAVAGLAAAVIAVPQLVSTGSPSGAVGAVRSSVSASGGASTAPRRLDARSVLLAAAATAAREPAASGAYWYTRERTVQPVRQTTKDNADVKALARELEDKLKEVDSDSGEAAALRKEYRQKIIELRSRKPPFSATTAVSQDSWYAREKGGSSRTVVNLDPKVTFASDADEQKWKEAGSPSLTEDKPTTSDYDIQLYFSIGTHRYTVRQLLDLPTDKGELESLLRRLRGEEADKDWGDGVPDFTDYVWSTAQDLLSGPLSPGTRAALYRVLAEQPGITTLGEVTDALGRTGQGLALKRADKGGEGGDESRLIVDDGTGRLLGYEVRSGEGSDGLRLAYEGMGWVDRLGEHPGD